MATEPISENQDMNDDIDLFELAFGEALGTDDPPKEDPSKEAPKEDEETPPKEKETPPKDEETPPEEKPKKEAPPEEKPKEKEKPKEEAKPKEKEKPKAEEEPPAEKPKEEPKPKEKPKVKTEDEIRAEILREQEEERKKQEKKSAENLSDDEQALLSEMEKDFPDVSKALKIQERILAAKFENMLDERMTKIQQELAPVFTTTQEVAQNAHEAAILKAHPDAFQILPQVEEWIDKQPTILKKAYNEALDKGTAAEINELFTVYKDANKTAASDGGETAEEKEARLAEEKKKQQEREKELQEQEGIRTRQTTRTAGIDENDFEGAFEAAASK